VVRRPGDSSFSKSPASNAEAPAYLELSEDFPVDVLVVASKLKEYIRKRSGMNTSDAVLSALSDRLRTLCDGAIRSAHEAERKTVLDRDFSS
jgi:histone H3/H4